jgi:hypothetical protein
MIFQPRKAALYRLAVEYGLQSPEQLAEHLPLGSSVPEPRLEGWLRQLFRLPKKFSMPRRYVNRFKIGADPEFVFAQARYSSKGETTESARVNAMDLGFQQGPAFGADNNGRLAEIRPYPSRSAVEVVASILCTLRWMVLNCPAVLNCEWRADPFLWEDGVGGHVHFGRKRPTRKQEVAALDQIEEGLLFLGLYPKELALRRRQGDARRQIYGALGDYRLQQHGYEYRTFPSWLDSPELAFFTLVVSKLAVQMPALYHFKGSSAAVEQARLRNFLAYFKGVDDDARLALMILDRGLPSQKKGSFAPRWGIVPDDMAKKYAKFPRIPIIPPCIKPDSESVDEIFEYLLHGKTFGFRVPKVTWEPTAPPKGYAMALDHSGTILAKGLGEMIWDLCVSTHCPIQFLNVSREQPHALCFPKDLVKSFPSDWRTRFRVPVSVADLRTGQISTTPHWREGPWGVRTKQDLLNGLLPIWRVKDCTEDSYKLWQEQAKKHAPPSRKLIGRVVYESDTHKVGPLAT